MGERVAARAFSRADRQRYRDKLRRTLDVFGRMLTESTFDFERPLTGMEIELNLVDDDAEPAMRNEEVLAAIANEVFQAELGQFNIELNVRPGSLAGAAATDLEAALRASLNDADERARAVGAHLVMIGTLPTLAPAHLTGASLTADARYALLNEQIFAARGEDLHIEIDGTERLSMRADTIAPEAACTSVQFHLQVSPQDYAATWNAAQCIAGVQVALGANSPFLFGKELWRETRIALFEQATDTRPEELKAQGVRPRVWFGERWITSVFDHFEENVTYFPALLPVCDDEDPAEVLARGDVPRLPELRMHNGTIYRWNRPVYDIHRGRPHLRVENRVLPAGPTVVDVLANGAFYFGLLRVLAAQERPLWSRMSFSTAEDNFFQAARHGINAQLYWPGLGTVPATELVLRRLLPIAQEGLAAWDVDTAVSDHLLGVIERRCTTYRNGAEWQAETFHRIDDEQQPLDRRDSLREMLRRYIEHMHSNEPVHTWPTG
ncbi:glutamate-cysteine ligase family protein [Geodermatophilus sp. YIM 151500]|uniref:glutamate-cysteine ligase family protein n=1 Tax=Geodermatophilus sp. YIM 151500 TaxID=2984531 RepID=UPI0021E4D07B|nr:glutamate-cysteine ligase family protein [Geodermatophilus sp. YIM 151500]MCV2489850.1 glutamate-cysteine ligase family protein [Geodermatophilus sp. YIM 151500]